MAENIEIVISGLSGRYPECSNVDELKEALLKGVDLVTDEDRRFPRGVMNIPPRMGKIPELDKFDPAFFGIHTKQAHLVDPRIRILLETVYEAIVDAGYNPKELRGTKTGVYVAMGILHTSNELRKKEKDDPYVNIGVSYPMAANRISYNFDFTGKSYTMDTACSSAMYALVNAFEDIKRGVVDAAVVCSAHALLHPQETSDYNKLKMLAADGKCKVFNTHRDGYVRGEAIITVLLQKKSISRRVYATIAGAASNTDGYKMEGMTFPSVALQQQLMDGIYRGEGIHEDEVTYMETHGTGTQFGDQQELQAIVNKFCKNRITPLAIGSVKSNMGHTEISAGLCSISKVIIAMETGVIPANLHAEPIDTTLPGIQEGTIKVVTENLPWNGGIIAINCFGIGGTNAHLALKPNTKDKVQNYASPRYRLVHVSGRTEEAVNHFLNEIERNRDEEFLALVDEIHKINVDGHYFRGYTVLAATPKREVARYLNAKPIWFVYSGVGSQWLGMGKDMMNNEIFRNTIQLCAATLKPYKVDLIDILTSTSPDLFNNAINVFAGIAAVEIAMTDILFSMGIKPDGIAGHSAGEILCSYADGLITAEEAILLAYARGYAIQNANLQAAAMGAIGLSKEECLKLLPEDIFISCQNGKDSVTVSGPEESVLAFVDKLTSQNIFAKAVNTGGIAYHSKYIADAVPYFYEFAKKVLTKPKLRSSKWISTSVNENQKNESWASYDCAEYHKNNLENPVLFDEIYQHIPENAIVIEVAPHGLMQAILKRELNSNNTILSLANRNSPDNEEFFLSSIGKIYLQGGQPNLKNIYKDVMYPVGRGTKMLSPLVKWDHSVNWQVAIWKHKNNFGKIISVNISEEEYTFMNGHKIDERMVMPATGYLVLAWRTLAHLHLKDMQDLPVIIEDFRLKRITILSPNTDVDFIVTIIKESGSFEICEGGAVVCTGTIYAPNDVTAEYSNVKCPEIAVDDYLPLTSEDVYRECHLRRYMYEGVFQGIKECDVNGCRGRIKWHGNFISFLDSMFHLAILSIPTRELLLPAEIKRIVIDPREHLKQVSGMEDIPIFFNKNVNVLRSGGIEINGTDMSLGSKRKQIQKSPLLETYNYLPYNNPPSATLDFGLSAAVQIVLQNLTGFIKMLKIYTFPGDVSNKLIEEIKGVLDVQPMVAAQYIEYNKNSEDKVDLIALTEDLEETSTVQALIDHLCEGGMILYQGDISKISIESFNMVFRTETAENGIYLLTPKRDFPSNYSVVYIDNSKFDWLEEIKKLVETRSKEVIFLVNQEEDFSGIVGLVKCLRTESDSLKLRCVLIQDKTAPIFSPDLDFYRDQLSKGVTFNILRDGMWGTFVHLPLGPIENKEVENATIDLLTVGDLSSLTWKQSFSNALRSDAFEKVYIHYSSLNFKDVMITSGKLFWRQHETPTSPDLNIGLEYSGITSYGRRVMGIVPNGGLSLQVCGDPKLTWDIPDEWTLDEAATVPIVYITCFYGMILRGQMRRGESILIHAGTGGVGLAAISIALSMGCEVFTTVGSQEKRDYLREMYPNIKDENIGDSRSVSFVQVIMENTQGRGVDMVLNSLSGKLFKESLRCVAPMGRFLEIGKVDFMMNTLIETKIFQNNCSFQAVTIYDIWMFPMYIIKQIQELIIEGIKSGAVRPLPKTIFKDHQVHDAFRFLSSGKHKGKVLIEIREENTSTNTPLVRTVSAVPKIYFDPNKSYILVGGLGGVALELTDWIIRRGATKIVLNSKRDVHSGYQSYCLNRWSKWECIQVKINIDDTTTIEGARNLVSFANLLGPVGGVFNLALVLKDGFVENQTEETYKAVFTPKLTSGINMDIVTRTECPELDHFVAFSSVTCGRGNSGQSNYGMANSAMEQLCEKRRRDHFPAMAVQWGPIGDVGVIARNKAGVKVSKLSEQMVAQNISSCIESLEKFLLKNPIIGASTVVSSKIEANVWDVTKTPVEAVAHILGIPNLETIDKSLTLIQLGMDSLMGAEIKQILYRTYNLEINVNEIRDLTLEKLIEYSKANDKKNISSQKKEIINKVSDLLSELLLKESTILMNQSEIVSKPVFFIHPIEGRLDLLKPIAEQLKIIAYGFQYIKDNDFETIEDYASCYIKEVKTKQPQGPYFLCGYSFGAIVALEMAMQLEKAGERVEIVLLEGSHTYSRISLETIFNKKGKSMDKFIAGIMASFISIFPTLEKDKVEDQLMVIEGWQNQLKFVKELVSKETGINPELVGISANGYYKRSMASLNYKPVNIFNGKAVLIKADTKQDSISEDYDLHQVCQQDLEILELNGNHNTVLLGENARIIAEKINSLL